MSAALPIAPFICEHCQGGQHSWKLLEPPGN